MLSIPELARFFTALAATGNFALACEAIGRAKSGLYKRRAADPVFAADVEAALAQFRIQVSAPAFAGEGDRPKGWNVVGSGRGEPQTNCLADGTRMPPNSYALLSVVQPAATFVRDSRLKREGRVGARDWEELCKVYGDRCAHCGKSGKHFDKGHMDPNKGMELPNLIPLCVECNNWAQEDVVFNEAGRVEAVRSERFLKKADRAAQERILGWLQRQF